MLDCAIDMLDCAILLCDGITGLHMLPCYTTGTMSQRRKAPSAMMVSRSCFRTTANTTALWCPRGVLMQGGRPTMLQWCPSRADVKVSHWQISEAPSRPGCASCSSSEFILLRLPLSIQRGGCSCTSERHWRKRAV
eukprot:3410647-Rhodomonas_salina.3